jgi:hypothetical protein
MAAALMKTRLPEVDLVEEGEPPIQDLMRFGIPVLISSYPLKQGAEINRLPFRLQDDEHQAESIALRNRENQPALSNARLIHAIKVASTSATALSLTL